MKVDQTILHDADTVGNCMQAAVATLLNLDLDDVPHFVEFIDWDTRFAAWLQERQMAWIVLSVDQVPDDMPCILAGQSYRDIAHVVVGRGIDIVHDPHPDRTGLKVFREAWVLCPYLPET